MRRFKNRTRIFVAIGILTLAVLTRLIPHPWGFTAMGAATLFCGFYLKDKTFKYFLPLLAFFISDLILGLHSTMIFIYFALAVSVYVGEKIQLQWKSWLSISLFNSLTFFFITNFGVWLSTNLYAKNISGLLQSYTMALPFLERQLVGDFLFGSVLFGIYSLRFRQAVKA